MKRTVLMTIVLLMVNSVYSSAEFYVATDGADTNLGTKAKPFASLEGARDAIRQLKNDRGLPAAKRAEMESC